MYTVKLIILKHTWSKEIYSSLQDGTDRQTSNFYSIIDHQRTILSKRFFLETGQVFSSITTSNNTHLQDSHSIHPHWWKISLKSLQHICTRLESLEIKRRKTLSTSSKPKSKKRNKHFNRRHKSQVTLHNISSESSFVEANFKSITVTDHHIDRRNVFKESITDEICTVQ